MSILTRLMAVSFRQSASVPAALVADQRLISISPNKAHYESTPRFDAARTPNTLFAMTTVQPPIDLRKWIEENADKFKPPVSNRYLYDGRDFFVMVIKGPNARNEFHLVDSEE